MPILPRIEKNVEGQIEKIWLIKVTVSTKMSNSCAGQKPHVGQW